MNEKSTKNHLVPVAGKAVAASSFGLFLSNKDPVRIDPESSDFNLNAPND